MNYSLYQNVPTFSQRHGIREVPGPPQLEEISPQARNSLWSALWRHLEGTAEATDYDRYLGEPWRTVLASVHQELNGEPLDDFDKRLRGWRLSCKTVLRSQPYHECFDLLETIMRHPECPGEFVQEVAEIFQHQLACRIDTSYLPTVIPAATKQESDTLLRALQDLEDAGLGGAAKHLREAGQRIIRQDWPGGVRESIHAVESVARQVAPGSADTLREALAVLVRQQGLHGALKKGFGALYGYASDEQGIRHALLEDESKVTQDEAIYMIGACAAFCSYLWRKYGPPDASPPSEASTP